jgi:hypothetical protein
MVGVPKDGLGAAGAPGQAQADQGAAIGCTCQFHTLYRTVMPRQASSCNGQPRSGMARCRARQARAVVTRARQQLCAVAPANEAHGYETLRPSRSARAWSVGPLRRATASSRQNTMPGCQIDWAIARAAQLSATRSALHLRPAPELWRRRRVGADDQRPLGGVLEALLCIGSKPSCCTSILFKRCQSNSLAASTQSGETIELHFVRPQEPVNCDHAMKQLGIEIVAFFDKTRRWSIRIERGFGWGSRGGVSPSERRGWVACAGDAFTGTGTPMCPTGMDCQMRLPRVRWHRPLLGSETRRADEPSSRQGDMLPGEGDDPALLRRPLDLSSDVRSTLASRSGGSFRVDDSKTLGERHGMNHCRNCDARTGRLVRSPAWGSLPPDL